MTCFHRAAAVATRTNPAPVHQDQRRILGLHILPNPAQPYDQPFNCHRLTRQERSPDDRKPAHQACWRLNLRLLPPSKFALFHTRVSETQPFLRTVEAIGHGQTPKRTHLPRERGNLAASDQTMRRCCSRLINESSCPRRCIAGRPPQDVHGGERSTPRFRITPEIRAAVIRLN